MSYKTDHSSPPPSYVDVIGSGAPPYYSGAGASGQQEHAPFLGSAGKIPLPLSGGELPVAILAPQPQIMRVQQPQAITVSMPSDYLGYAIFTCICCFWPVGLMALIRSCQCRSARAVGNATEAKKLSNKVLCLSHTALIIGIILISIEIILHFGFRKNRFMYD